MASDAATAHAEALKLPGALPTLPISDAKKPFNLDFVNEARKYFNNFHMILGGDHAAYYVSHLSEFVLSAIAMPSGPVRELPRAISPDIGKTTLTIGGGGGQSLTLDDYLNNGKHRVQGLMMLHQGKVVYEAYPGIQPTQLHAWASVSKTANGLMAAILEADGALDVSKAASAYVTELKGTPWDNVSVFNILNMASGLDISETEAANKDPDSMFNRVMAADCGSLNAKGVHETALQVLKDVKTLPGEKAGEYARYSSVAAKVLCMICESASNRPLISLIEERVWSKIGARGPLTCSLSPEGGAMVYGFICSTLEDLAHYALIYTPSWRAVSDVQIVPPKMLERIRHSGSESAYQKGDFMDHGWVRASFGASGLPTYNSWQWDAVLADGAMFKHGNMMQGIYVHPERDFVGVYFCTYPTYLDPDILPGYIREASQGFAIK